jgi:hypothetical protein
MKKLILVAMFLVLPDLSFAQSPPQGFAPVGQFYLFTGSPTGRRIDELYKSWGYGTDDSVSTTTNIPGTWIASPNLTAAPYNLACPSGGTVTAVMLTIKVKVKTVTWSTYQSLGNIQISVRSPNNIGQNNEIIHAYSEKAPGFGSNLSTGGLTTEDLNINTVPVGVLGGVFHIFTDVTVNPYVTIDRVVYLTGYWCG